MYLPPTSTPWPSTSLACPGMSHPAGFGAGGLPVGLQLIGNYFGEARLPGTPPTSSSRPPTGTPAAAAIDCDAPRLPALRFPLAGLIAGLLGAAACAAAGAAPPPPLPPLRAPGKRRTVLASPELAARPQADAPASLGRCADCRFRDETGWRRQGDGGPPGVKGANVEGRLTRPPRQLPLRPGQFRQTGVVYRMSYCAGPRPPHPHLQNSRAGRSPWPSPGCQARCCAPASATITVAGNRLIDQGRGRCA